MVPIVHSAAAHAALSSVENAYVPPYGAIQIYKMDSGKDTFVVMQANEPISLFCHDETDGAEQGRQDPGRTAEEIARTTGSEYRA